MMDIKNHDVYSQMCILSDDIQSIKSRIGWFDQYDMVINKQTGVKLVALQLIENKYNANVAWIPTQNQLQTLILQYQSDISIYVEDFNDWYKSDIDFYKNLPNLTVDILLIMYYMERHHRKFWCWGCGFWKDISEKKFEITERNAIIKSGIIE